MHTLAELLAHKGYLVLDGAMGTQLFAAGLTSGDAPERWNVEHPDRIRHIHAEYIEAGADIVLTNSFGGTRYRLALHQLDHRVQELARGAAGSARAAADAVSRPVLVAGSLGPTGELIDPLGALSRADAEAAFAEQARGLADGGADLLWLETLSDLNEVEAAIAGARLACDLPIAVTMSYDTAGHTMMGVSGAEAVARLAPHQLAALGANCGNNIADTEAVVGEIKRQIGDTPVISKANAGIPEWRGADLHYDGTPEVMAAHANRVRAAGVSLIGGCCGSTPSHIELMARVLAGDTPVPDVEQMPAGAGAATAPRPDGAARRSGRRRRRSASS